MHADIAESMEHQLRALYEEREYLQERFGISSAEEIVGMVECLEAQLKDFYSRYGGQDSFGETDSSLLLDRLKDLSAALDPHYSRKTVQFLMESDKPVIRAEWSQTLNHGDRQ